MIDDPENEAFEELEREIKEKEARRLEWDIQSASSKFLADFYVQLGYMSPKQIFEIGFKTGYEHGTDSRTK
jgi:hypothetical protein